MGWHHTMWASGATNTPSVEGFLVYLSACVQGN